MSHAILEQRLMARSTDPACPEAESPTALRVADRHHHQPTLVELRSRSRRPGRHKAIISSPGRSCSLPGGQWTRTTAWAMMETIASQLAPDGDT